MKLVNELIHRIMDILMYTLFTVWQIVEFIVLWFTHIADTIANGKDKPLSKSVREWFNKTFELIAKKES